MTPEDKQLLLKDLCARLPYGVKVRYKSVEGEGDIKLGYGNIGYVSDLGRGWWIECKPYLRPMSSMSDEEKKKYNQFVKGLHGLDGRVTPLKFCEERDLCKCFDWLNAHHFDYCGLIKKDLAIAVTEENNQYKKQ